MDFGLVGSTLYLANATDARDAFLSALPEVPRTPRHMPDWSTSIVRRRPQALAKLSVFDTAASPDLASLFGVAVEANPLLRALGEADLVLDSEGTSARVRGTLHLAPPPHP